jgi:peptide/nickel transport system permease protein
VVIAVSALSFCLFELAPGDFFDELRLDPSTTPATIAELRKQHGLDVPAPVRYLRWLGSVLRGEWGLSVTYNSPAGPILFDRARNTLILTASAAVASWAISIPLGVWAATGGKWRRLSTNSVVALFLSLPEVVVLLGLLTIAAYWRVLPAGGMNSLEFNGMFLAGRISDLIAHLIAPVTALVVSSLPTLILHTRAALVEALNSEFVRFARANGIPKKRLLIRHALPAAANPMITLLGLSAGTLLSSSLLVEAIVGWPGLGHLLLQALLQRDLLVVAGAVLLSSIFLVSGNLLADILLYTTDPRIREGSNV